MKKIFCSIFILLMSMSSFSAEIVSYYTFDGTLEDVVGPYDGTIMSGGEPSYIISPYSLGQALLLDGSQYVDIGYGQPKGEVMRNGSVSLWFNKASAATGYRLFFGTMNSGFSKAVWAGINPSGFMEFGLRNELGDNITWTYDERQSISPDTWYFYTVTWGVNSQTGNLDINEYLDGVLIRSGAQTDLGGVSWQFSVVLGAGNSRGSIEDIFVGALDDIKFYNYPLSESEVIQEYINVTEILICLDPPIADLTDDCKVNLDDLAILADEWFLDGNLYPSSFSNRIYVESKLPAYLNAQEAILVFERLDMDAEIELELAFCEKKTQQVPTAPRRIVLSGPNAKHEEVIDISTWPDGEYKVTISGPDGRYGTDTLIRAIRKQTIGEPQDPAEPISAGGTMLLVDDYYLESCQGLEFKAHQAELLPITPWQQDPSLKRWVNSLQEFWFNADNSVGVRILGYDTLGGPTIEYIAVTSDFETWNIDILSGGAMITQYSALTETYRFYDPVIDGNVNLSEVDVVWTGVSGATWGAYQMPRRSMYAIWRKAGENVILQPQYDPITQDKLEWGDDDIGDWEDTNDNFGAARLYENDTILRFFQARRIPRWEPYRIHYDNIWSNRIMVTWSSTDGIEWTPTYFSVPTEQDPVGYQHYKLNVFDAGMGLEAGYFLMYDQALQQLNTELVYSRNGLLWNRFGGSIFLDNSDAAPGDWNFGYCMRGGVPDRLENQGCFYEHVNGINVLHFMFLHAHNNSNRETITVESMQSWNEGRLTGDNGIENSPIWDWYGSWDDVVNHTREEMWTPGLMKYRSDGWFSIGPNNIDQQGIFITKQFTSDESVVFEDDFESNTTVSAAAWPDGSGDHDPDNPAVGSWSISEDWDEGVQVSSFTGGAQPASAHSGNNYLIAGYHGDYDPQFQHSGLATANFTSSVSQTVVDFWVWGFSGQYGIVQGRDLHGVNDKAFELLFWDGFEVKYDGVELAARLTNNAWNHIVVDLDLVNDTVGVTINNEPTEFFTAGNLTDAIDTLLFRDEYTGYYDDILVTSTSAGTMAINAKTDAQGFIKIEVLDASGVPLPDYCGANAALFTGDSVASNLTWSGGSITQPPAFAYKLKVTIYKGDLYAFYW